MCNSPSNLPPQPKGYKQRTQHNRLQKVGAMSEFTRIKELTSLTEYAEATLEHKAGGLVCPCCGSGNGPKHTPAFSIKGKGDTWKCFSCNEGGDIFDLAGKLHKTENKREQLEIVAAWAGIPLEGKARIIEFLKPETKHEQSTRTQPNTNPGKEKHKAIIEAAQAAFIEHPEAVSYWQARGFTLEEAAAFGIGYNAQAKRLVMPWAGNDYYHVDRDITGKQKAKYQKPKSEEVGRQPLYNPQALKEKTFFMVEGVLDALAINACGFEAVALVGTGARAAIEEIQARQFSGLVIVLLDNDTPGKEAAERAGELLEKAGIAYLIETQEYNDTAEHLQADRKGLTSYLAKVHEKALETLEQKAQEEYSEIMGSLRVFNPAEVAAGIYLLDNAKDATPTGFKQLDGHLGGGLVPGVYILGALSSLGKTTLTLQIADNIAASGQGVLFFTIEQSARELTAKSLSRYMARLSPRYAGITAGELTRPAARAAHGEELDIALLEAVETYGREVAPNLGIQEGIEKPSAEDIKKAARAWQHYHNGQAPVIFIDYLQLMAAPNERDTDKQAVDKNITKLRQIARDLQTPVFAISSLNRNSINAGLEMDSFKESGGIEYGADVLLGLQPLGMGETLRETNKDKQRKEATGLLHKHKQALERACELVILKHRDGQPGITIPLTFKPARSTFEEREESSRGKAIII